MKKALYFLLILIWFWPACTTQKHVRKDKASEKQETITEQKTETTSQVTTNTDTRIVSITTTIEQLDTTILVPGSTIYGIKLLADLLAGNTLKVESDDQVMEVFWDSLSNTIKAQATDKPKTVPVTFSRTIEKKELVSTKTQKQENIATVDEKQSAERSEAVSESRDMEVKRTYWPIWVGGTVVFVVVVVLLIRVFLLWRRKLFM